MMGCQQRSEKRVRPGDHNLLIYRTQLGLTIGISILTHHKIELPTGLYTLKARIILDTQKLTLVDHL
jgi:hypothetical protein